MKTSTWLETENISVCNISHKLLRVSQFLEEFMEMLQHIGRVATLKLVARNCLRYLQTTLTMVGGDWFQNECEVLSKKLTEN